jgi:hypothetical protein
MARTNHVDGNIDSDDEALQQIIAGHGYRDLRRQPVRSLYLFYQFTSTLFIRVPFWTVSYISKSNRPWKTWSLRRSVLLRALAHLLENIESRSPYIPRPPLFCH